MRVTLLLRCIYQRQKTMDAKGMGLNSSLHAEPAARQAESGSAAPRRRLRELLAEDTRANQKLVRYILGRRGHEVEIAENGQDAVDLLCRQQFDVVLMDVQMPVLDGFQATAAIRKLSDRTKAAIPTVALTTTGAEVDSQRCLAAGMDAYVTKPISSEELIETVERLGAQGRNRDSY